MNELDVRHLLYQTEIRRVLAGNPGHRVVDELELARGEVRVDVAVIGDILHGYEIKSARDNLLRLPRQRDFYGKVFEKMTLVADEKHVEEAVKIVPVKWGLISVGLRDGKPYAEEIWPARLNNESLDALAIAQLLWREEAIELMEYFDLDRGLRDKPRKILWQTLANKLTVKELKAFVCYKLRTRKDWKLPKRVFGH
ncbi:MAG: sce7726 family protein [Candidatus Obscuribacterales bacterium]|nr:sce7726 family protein [Candidatus Obscuribacterales bacterium]